MTFPTFGILMVFDVLTMKKPTHANDNETLSFLTLAAVTANVVRYLERTHQKHEDAERNAQGNSANDKEARKNSPDIEHSLNKRTAT